MRRNAKNILYEELINKSVEGETGEVPLYRSYGVKKKVRKWHIALNVLMARLLATALFFIEFAIIIVVSIALVHYGGVLISTLITATLTVTLLSIQTRVARRRLGFRIKLKKLCRQQGYRLTHKRSFFHSLRWDEKDGVDFVLTAGSFTYYVKYFTPKRPLSSVTFLSKDAISYTKHPRRNVFTTIFGFRAKTKIMPLRFPSHINNKDKNIIKAIIVNPKPRDILVKNPEGSIVPTGTGEKIYGYTIFTGKGFLRSVKQNSESSNANIQN